MATGSGRSLHVFDMDGTLLRSTAVIELARHFGDHALGHEIETRGMAGRMTDREFWQATLEICEGASEADIDAAFLGAAWMDGVRETFADIRARGDVAIVVSQSPAFFVRRFALWGVHETYGSDVELGRELPEVILLASAAKVTITRDALARHGLTEQDCVAYGDSLSDVDLFRWLPRTVGVNPTPDVAALATTSYLGTDIRDAYALGRGLLATATAEAS